MDRTIPFSPDGTLRLKTFSGRVTITGKSANEVVIHAVRRATRDRLDRIKLDIRVSGPTIKIEANKKEDSWFNFRGDNVVETDFDIQVPVRTKLEVSVFSSSVGISGVSGPHDVHGFSSDLTLRSIDGRLKARTFSGSIHIDLASTANAPELDVDTFSGDIDVRLNESAKGNLSFNSFSGDLRSDIPLILIQKSRRRLSARLNDGGSNELQFKTFSGDVRLTR
ncbi:MAG: DUF4097 family beta strand repeat protein [Acidobacteria bacterium]|nr:DUF4097 family beta strand repeat protein [Acidobacteriota bacterium]